MTMRQHDRDISQSGANPAPMLEAARVDSASAMQDDVVRALYCLHDAASSENRLVSRSRTRLRTGKIADARGNFLADCQIYDRSTNGARIRLFDDLALPPHLALFDDEFGVLRPAVLVWRRAREAGLRLAPRCKGNISARRDAALRRPFHALAR